MSSITSELARVSGPVALLLIAALVFGETAVVLGLVIPGETARCSGRAGQPGAGLAYAADRRGRRPPA